MPSPIAHTAAAYAVYTLFSRTGDRGTSPSAAIPVLFAAAVFLSLLPDLPTLAALFGAELSSVHNNWEHSLMVALVVALVCGVVVQTWGGGSFGRWFLLALLCYSLHVLMDLFTVGRGVMLLWPFSAERFSPPFKLFYGLHWSDGWMSARHWWTLLTEAVFALVVVLFVRWRPAAVWSRRDGKG